MLYQMMGDWNGWGGMMGSWGWGWPFALGGAFILIGVAAAVLWLWMLIDCLMRRDEDFPGKGAYDKLVWVIVLLFANIIGAVLYYLIVRAKGRGYREKEKTARGKMV